MYRRVLNFAVAVITILTANLITSFITDKLISYKWEVRPLKFTLISMGIITLIFYPLFIRLQEWIDSFSRRFVKAGHSFAGKYAGLLLMFAAGLLILTYFYLKMWYHMNLFQMILKSGL